MIQAHQQTTTIDTWPYYEFEDFIKLLNVRNEEERSKNKESEKNQNNNNVYGDTLNKLKDFKPPKFNIPKF